MIVAALSSSANLMQEFDFDKRQVELPEFGDSFPRVLSLSGDGTQALLTLDVAAEMNWFRGHFPDQPVLPGVIQLHWAVIVASACFDLAATPREVKRLKFKNIVTPPKTLTLTVSLLNDDEVQFRFDDASSMFSEGRLVFAGDVGC